jgi:aryl-alcohol dehydrogenase-like predicted oxidoreductase
MSEFILGTANFGSIYGIANDGIKLSNRKINKIIQTAQKNEVKEFDTAPTYGEAEILLGKFLDTKYETRISSKISQKECTSVNSILDHIKKTIIITNIEKLSNLYLHDPEPYNPATFQILREGLAEAKLMGLIERVGASVYSLNSLKKIKNFFPEMTVFQVPENICDRRLYHSDEIRNFFENGDKFIVRSVFLQGLLLMPFSRIKISRAIPEIAKLTLAAKKMNMSNLDLCLAYARSIPWSSGIIVGSASPKQLKEILKSKYSLPDNWESIVSRFPDDLLDPRLW